MQRGIIAAACVLALAAGHLAPRAAPSSAMAQTPSADDIINGLKPTAKNLNGPTRGIRPVTVAPSKAGQPEPAAEPADTGDAEAPSVKLVVDFATGSAQLTPRATQTLDQLGKALTSPSLSAYRFRVEGHTDTVGSPETNKDLSERRAQAVADYLEQKFNIAANRLEPVGLGSSELLVPTPDQTPEPRNRRVRIVNLGS